MISTARWNLASALYPYRWSSYPERKKTNSWIVSISREERMPTFQMGSNAIKNSIIEENSLVDSFIADRE